MALSLLAGCSTLPRPIVPAPLGQICLSTAVDIKTVTCNSLCNADPETCPLACVCSAAGGTPHALSFAMPSEPFLWLAGEVDARRKTAPAVPAASKLRKQLGAANPNAHVAAPAELPEDMFGFYAKTWACKEPFLNSSACLGPPDRNIDVVFSGYSSVDQALQAAMNQGDKCSSQDMDWCTGQSDFMTNSAVPKMTRKQAIKAILEPGAATEPTCKRCLDPKKDASQERLQFLTIGGANAEGMVTAAALDGVEDGLEAVKEAGFAGLCFDIELTVGDQDLVEAQERAFAACKRAGLLVMVTTSHSAPVRLRGVKPMRLRGARSHVLAPAIRHHSTQQGPRLPRSP